MNSHICYMKHQNFLIIISLILTIFWNCSSSQKLNEAELKKKYNAAIKDAEIAEASEISDKLTEISPINLKLAWKKFGKEDYVKMLTWTNWDGYSKSIGKQIPVEREVWVTAFPDVQEFCKKNNGKNLILRLEQLLGLPSNNKKTRFVELWVRPIDMFRPAPDPEINDNRAELTYPKNVKKEHVKWIELMRASSYSENGYPWTRLGYTYDWGNLNTEVGMSEFVVKKNSKIYIESDTANEEYCKD